MDQSDKQLLMEKAQRAGVSIHPTSDNSGMRGEESYYADLLFWIFIYLFIYLILIFIYLFIYLCICEI
jgi:hypothetical protein